MKKLIKPLAMMATAIIACFSLSSMTVAHKTGPGSLPVTAAAKTSSFSIEVNQPDESKCIFLSIKNPEKKNLYVSLNGPDGYPIHDFFTGRHSGETRKTYNFSLAQTGLYTIMVRYGKESISRKIKFEHLGVQSIDRLTVE